MKWVLLIYLTINAVSDIRTGTIDLRISFAAAFLLTLWQLYLKDTVSIEGMVVGVVLIFLSLMSCGAIGSGDGVIIMVLGWILGPLSILSILAYACLLVAVVGVLCWISGKRNMRELPLIPFVELSYLYVVMGVWTI